MSETALVVGGEALRRDCAAHADLIRCLLDKSDLDKDALDRLNGLGIFQQEKSPACVELP